VKPVQALSTPVTLDVDENRRTRKYSPREQLLRVLWSLARPIFRFSPRPCFAWRRFLLRCFGASVGRHVHVYGSATVYLPWRLTIGDRSCIGEHAYIYNLGPVSIGSGVTISQHAYLCAGTHDHTRAEMPLLKPPIRIGDLAWICAGAFIGPNVEVGAGAIVGARAVATRAVPAWTIVAGNPARFLKRRVVSEHSGTPPIRR
jgi:putative colanic acid biosynthesis acetyltransferase WcaF